VYRKHSMSTSEKSAYLSEVVKAEEEAKTKDKK
jgi:hypothetical protein